MADISTYPLATPKATDLVLGTQTNALGTNHTKSFTVGSIADKVPSIQLGYTSLVQLLNQTGTNAPVATEVYNNTGQTFTWSYVSQGVYRITSTGTPFTVNKTVVFINTGSINNGVFEPRWSRISDTVVEIVSSSDYLCTNGSFEIKIYN
jgi:hypothetical protein